MWYSREMACRASMFWRHGVGVDALLAAHDGELAVLGRDLARNPADHRIEAGLAHRLGFELELAGRPS